MRELTEDFILAGTLNAQENTWKKKFNATLPNIKKEECKIKLSNGNHSVYIDSFDEIVLTIVLKFLFCPVWLTKQFYETWMIAGIEDPANKIKEWVDIGLVWIESDVTGLYIRPTFLLFKLFGETPEKFYNIPFNTLRHTICEQKVMFDVMCGNSEILKRENTLPRISELGFEDSEKGTNILTECDFRNPYLYKDEGIIKLSETENKINEGMKNGEIITPELLDFSQFVLIKKVNNKGSVKKDYKFHIPDLIIPVIRKNGKPQSIAIEVELSNKRGGYIETMERYKNNNKYGSVYWLCRDSSTIEALRAAYEEVGGTGTCKTILLEFVVPSPKF